MGGGLGKHARVRLLRAPADFLPNPGGQPLSLRPASGVGKFVRRPYPNPRSMTLRWLFAALHLLALGIGLGAIWTRSRALRQSLDAAGLQRVFAADTWWGLAAVLWLTTGVIRMVSGLEKGPEYYINNRFFLLKMVLFVTIVALEIGSMRALIRWRAAVGRGELPDTTRAPTFATRSTVQAVLVVLAVFAAAAMARGLGMS